MARSSRKSLAGSAAAAAKKVIGRRSTATGRAGDQGTGSATTKATKKSPAKKSPAKKTAAQKSAATKKTAAKKTAAKKSTAKQATPAKKTAAKKSTAKQATPAKKGTTKKTAAKKAPAKKTAAPRATKSAPKKAAKQSAASTTAQKGATVTKKTATTAKKPTRTATRKAGQQGRARGGAPSPAALVVKEEESRWTKAELDEVLADLHEHRDKLAAQVTAAERELAGLMKDSGDGAGQDQADMGATSFERDHELTVVNNERDMLAQTERALARIEDGTYGVCEGCGEPIGKMRLMAFPRATLCLSCKQREERR